MHVTTEVRWFYPGVLPERVRTWFAAFDPNEQDPRTDYYLLPTDEALNVKWREGQIEAKRRDSPGKTVLLADTVAGTLECWRKWSYTLENEQAVAGELFWQAVTKHRHMVGYQRGESGALVRVRQGEARESGCDVELSQLEMDDALWWSICFEAFGDSGAARKLLVDTAALVFIQGTPPALGLKQSRGYAAWLLEQASQP